MGVNTMSKIQNDPVGHVHEKAFAMFHVLK
jgi:hypothetical protein